MVIILPDKETLPVFLAGSYWSLLFSGLNNPTFSDFLYRGGTSAFWSYLWPSFGLACTGRGWAHVLCWGPRWTQYSRWGLMRVERENHFLGPVSYVAFDAASGMAGFLSCDCTMPAHKFSSTSTLKSFSTRLLFVHLLSILYSCLGLSWSRCCNLHLALLNHVVFMWAHLECVKVPLDGIPSPQ